MKQQVKIALLGLGIIFALGAGVYWFISSVIDKLSSINSELGKALIGASVAIFVAAITVVVGKLWEQRIKIRQEVRDKKVPVYEDQMRVIFGVLFASKEGKSQEEVEKLLKPAFAAFTEKLMIWGSSEVIKSWQAFRSHQWDGSAPTEGFRKFEEFVLSIRKDIGSENKNLNSGDLLRLFINDYDQKK